MPLPQQQACVSSIPTWYPHHPHAPLTAAPDRWPPADQGDTFRNEEFQLWILGCVYLITLFKTFLDSSNLVFTEFWSDQNSNSGLI